MRPVFGVVTVITLLCAFAAPAQPARPRSRPMDRPGAAGRLPPALMLPAGPLRAENITDLEVTEVRTAVAEVVTGEFVNIGSVIQGCVCEEGPSCQAQLRVVVYQPGESIPLALSQQDGHWRLGKLQTWILQRRAFEDRYRTLRFKPDAQGRADYQAYADARQALYDQMPHCETGVSR